ncbi:MAG: DnaJ domain-containing protein [Nitrospirae bacterium]|nr:DnaJ domain-containing protein [Nitrospirota bacterium]
MDQIPLSGTLRQYPYPLLLRSLHADRQTGTLSLSRGEVRKRVFFREGEVIYATSNYDDDRLGEFLVKAGKITVEQYDRSVALLKETGKQQGAILVELGYLTPKDLFQGLRLQIAEIAKGIFLWEEGDYNFFQGELPTDVLTLPVPFRRLLVEGIRTVQDFTRFRQGLPKPESLLRRTNASRAEEYPLEEAEQRILALTDGGKTLREVCSASGLMDYEAYKAVYFLIHLGCIEAESGVKSQESGVLDSQLSSGLEEIEQEAPETPATLADPELLEDLRKALRTLKGQDHYVTLGVKPSTSAKEIRRAYLRLAKSYHPDRYQHAASEIKLLAGEIFTAIAAAYHVLNDRAKRKSYDVARTSRSGEEDRGAAYSTRQAQEQFLRGKDEFQKGNYWGAEEFFKWAARMNPDNAVYQASLARAQSQIPGRLHQAEEACRKAIALEPTNAEHHVLMGKIYGKAGLHSRAVTQFQEALNWEPEHPAALKELEALGAKKASPSLGDWLSRKKGK